MKTKNKCLKTRKVDEPYEIWKSFDLLWEWRVLKKWQIDDNKPYARWFCAVKSPMTYNSWEYGDVYVKEIKQHATKTYPNLKIINNKNMKTLQIAKQAIKQTKEKEQKEKEQKEKEKKEQYEKKQKEKEQKEKEKKEQKGITKDGKIICRNCKEKTDYIYASGNYTETGYLNQDGEIDDWSDMDQETTEYTCPNCGEDIKDQINW